MAISAYFAESEDTVENVISIGGFIGFADEWESLEEKWTARLKPTGVNAYRMSDCENGCGEFSEEMGWTKSKREQLTKDLIEIVLEHEVFMIGSAALLHSERQMQDTGLDGNGGKHQWHLPFQAIMQEAAWHAVPYPPEVTVAFFFDMNSKIAKAKETFLRVREDEKIGEWRRRLGTIEFCHKEFDVPGSSPRLQVADIAAVEIRKHMGNSIAPIAHPNLPSMRKSMQRFIEQKRIENIPYYNLQGKPAASAARR